MHPFLGLQYPILQEQSLTNIKKSPSSLLIRSFLPSFLPFFLFGGGSAGGGGGGGEERGECRTAVC